MEKIHSGYLQDACGKRVAQVTWNSGITSMKINRRFVYSVLVVLLVVGGAGCIPVPTVKVVPTKIFDKTPEITRGQSFVTPPATETVEYTPEPSKTSQATKTSTASASVRPSETPSPGFPIMELPITMMEMLDIGYAGNIVLIGETPNIFGAPLKLYDPLKTDKIELGQAFDSISVSPSGEHLAFVSTDHVVKIVNESGKLIYSLPGPANWRGVIQWVNSNQLLIENMPLHGDGTLNPPASSLLLDIVTEEQRDFLPLYPVLPVLSLNWGNHGFTNAVYDPFLKQGIFAGGLMGGITISLNLVNIESQEIILALQATDLDCGGGPKWLSDGRGFISCLRPQYYDWNNVLHYNIEDKLPYVGGYDLAQINRNGRLERLTFLTTRYVAAEEGISLSPDQNRVAFWLNLDYSIFEERVQVRYLSVLDLDTRNITKYDFQGSGYPYPPVWSPDGKYVAVTVTDFPKDISDVYVVGLEQGQAVKIAEHSIALAWMADTVKSSTP